jgi:hypothetical protein
MKLMMNRYGQRTAAKAYTWVNSKSAESSKVGQFSVDSNSRLYHASTLAFESSMLTLYTRLAYSTGISS